MVALGMLLMILVYHRDVTTDSGYHGDIADDSNCYINAPCLHIVLHVMTNGNIASFSRKLDAIQIIFDHTTSTAAIYFIFNRMKVGGDNRKHVSSEINDNKLASDTTTVEISIGKQFSYARRRWQMESMDGDTAYGYFV